MSNNVTKGLIKQCYLCSCTSSELKSDVNVSTCSVRYFRMTVWLEMRSRFSRKHSSTLPPQNVATEIRYYSLPIPTPVDRIADTCENITFQQLHWAAKSLSPALTTAANKWRRLCFYTCVSGARIPPSFNQPPNNSVLICS